MMNTTNASSDRDVAEVDALPSDAIPLSLVFAWLRGLRYYAVGGIMVGVLLGIVIVHLQTPQFEARMALVPTSVLAEPRSGASLSLDQGIVGGLLGVSGLQSSSEIELLTGVIGSVAMIRRLGAYPELLEHQAGLEWDAETSEWLEPTDLLFRTKKLVRRLLGLQGWYPPSEMELARRLQDHLEVVSAGGNGALSVLAYQHPEAERARLFLGVVFEEADQLLRERRLSAVERDRRMLLEQLESLDAIQVRQRAYEQILLAEINNIDAKVNASYGMTVFDEPSVSSRPVSPSLTISLLVGMTLGLTVALLFGVWRTLRSNLLPL